MIYGDTEAFAVEFTRSSDHRISPNTNIMGYGKLWIQGHFYGTNEDLIYLKGYLYHLLDDLLKAPALVIDGIGNRSGEDLYELLSSDDSSYRYRIHSSPFTDDFIGFKFRNEGKISMVWKIRTDQSIPFSDLVDYSTAVHYCSVRSEAIERAKELLELQYGS